MNDLIAAHSKLQERFVELEEQLAACNQSGIQLYAECQSLQAKIDNLMFEYCPGEMTPEQLEEWGINQVKSTVAIPGE